MSRTANPKDDFVQAGVVAQMLHVSPKTIARWATEGQIPSVRTLGGHRRFHKPTIQTIIDALAKKEQEAKGA
jgi:excisionase family DNA binding protein